MQVTCTSVHAHTSLKTSNKEDAGLAPPNAELEQTQQVALCHDDVHYFALRPFCAQSQEHAFSSFTSLPQPPQVCQSSYLKIYSPWVNALH